MIEFDDKFRSHSQRNQMEEQNHLTFSLQCIRKTSPLQHDK